MSKWTAKLTNVHFSNSRENDRSISAAEKATEWCHRKSVSHLSTHGLHVIDSLTVNLYISQYSVL